MTLYIFLAKNFIPGVGIFLPRNVSQFYSAASFDFCETFAMKESLVYCPFVIYKVNHSNYNYANN